MRYGLMSVATETAKGHLCCRPLEQRERFHWVVAVRMLDHALREPRYLKAATISFQTALVLDGVLAPS
jgi:hypothetical protein